ncbi:MAG TPA: S8 family serine peptidase [Sedimentisphaerales bacterium]|nr:S8 family serine peptidase [Sedimentisphaerales bacterium]
MKKCILSALLVMLLGGSLYGSAAIGPDGSNAAAVHALGYTGQGVNVGFISFHNILTTHEAFFDKDGNGLPTGPSNAFAYNMTDDESGIIVSAHDTWAAGVIASRGGAAHPNAIGVAPGVNIHNARVVRPPPMTIDQFTTALQNALDALIVTHGCRVIYTGFQVPPQQFVPNGNSTLTMIYDYYADTHDVVFANAAGNAVDLNTNITVFGDAYNGITTGGLAVVEPHVWRRVGSVSNLGPTADNRRKPDVVAPSQNQVVPTSDSSTAWLTWTSASGETSLSVPHTAGVAALLLEYADSTTTQPDDHRSEVIRAVIVNAAFPNIHDNAGASTAGQIYNFARGYGRLDALRSLQTLAAARITPGNTPPSTADRGWAYATITAPRGPAVVQTYSINGVQSQRLVATIAWNRRVTRSGGVYTAAPLVNLQLTVRDPDGNVIFSDTDALNNLKKCDILLTRTGTYKIEVTLHNNVTPPVTLSQDYGLAFDIIEPIAGDFDLNYIVDHRDLAAFANQWLLSGAALTADIAPPAGHVDFADFAAFASNWLASNNAYYEGY